MERRKLSESEVADGLTSLDGWTEQDGQIVKTYRFKTYAAGVMFAGAAGQIADAMDHHPDILITYQQVRLAVNTHDVGGISPVDFKLARRVDAIA